MSAASHLTSTQLIWLLVFLSLAHLGMLACAIFSRKINLIYVLSGAFIVFSLLSASTGLGILTAAKWIRVYVGILMVLFGIFGYKVMRIGVSSLVLSCFVAFYVFAALWSPAPIAGFIYKGLLGLVVFSGVIMAYSVKNEEQLAWGLRFLGVVAGGVALAMISSMVQNPGAALANQRLSLWGLNPIRIGMTISPLCIIAMYLALHDKAKFWKIWGYVSVTMLAILILFTGSRATSATAFVGCFSVFLPTLRRPVKAILIVLFLTLIGWVVVETVEIPGMMRALGMDKSIGSLTENREAVWARAQEMFMKNPLMGQGWYYSHVRLTTGNLHSVYWQSLVETGLVGTAFFVFALGFASYRGLKMLLTMRGKSALSGYVSLPLGLLLAIILHGFGEAGILMGSTVNSLFLGFSVGLIDYLPSIVASRQTQPVMLARRVTTQAQNRFPMEGEPG